jgi:hypothetical protein
MIFLADAWRVSRITAIADISPLWHSATFEGKLKESVVGFNDARHAWLGIMVVSQRIEDFMPPNKRRVAMDFANLGSLADTESVHHALEE